MSPKGNYYVSSFQNSFCRQFTKEERHGIVENIKEKSKIIKKENVPGVGTYQLPSDFAKLGKIKK